MLQDKWLITDRQSVFNMPRNYFYTLALVDSDNANLDTYTRQLVSDKRLKVGSFTDHDLNPLETLYNPELSDVAIVKDAYYLTQNEYKKISFFTKSSSDWETIVPIDYKPFPLKRGQTILFCVSKIKERVNGKTLKYTGYEFVENLSTGVRQRPTCPPLQKNQFLVEGVVYGLDRCDEKGISAKKYIELYSPKFELTKSFVVSCNAPEYSIRPRDKILVVRNPDTGLNILRNLTTDRIHSNFVKGH